MGKHTAWMWLCAMETLKSPTSRSLGALWGNLQTCGMKPANMWEVDEKMRTKITVVCIWSCDNHETSKNFCTLVHLDLTLSSLLLQFRGSISVPVWAAGKHVDSLSAMSSSVFTQCEFNDGILDYEIDTSKANLSFPEPPSKKPKFAVIHDVARPARQFVISQSKTGLAHPVETCPEQPLAYFVFYLGTVPGFSHHQYIYIYLYIHIYMYTFVASINDTITMVHQNTDLQDTPTRYVFFKKIAQATCRYDWQLPGHHERQGEHGRQQ